MPNNDDIEMLEKYDLYKKNEGDKIWWVDIIDKRGMHCFTFDKKKVFNVFRDYPWALTNDEKEIFDRENPYWADFFKNRPRHKD